MPDAVVYRWERSPLTAEGEVVDNFTEPPDIAVEIISPGQSVTGQVPSLRLVGGARCRAGVAV